MFHATRQKHSAGRRSGWSGQIAGAYRKGDPIGGLDVAGADGAVIVFHAGTRTGPEGEILAHGGRVLGVTATGDDLGAARDAAYAAIGRIDWPGGFCRRDIAAG